MDSKVFFQNLEKTLFKSRNTSRNVYVFELFLW